MITSKIVNNNNNNNYINDHLSDFNLKFDCKLKGALLRIIFVIVITI